MKSNQVVENNDESFYSSSASHLGKSRRWLWLSAVLGLAISAARNKGSVGSLLFSTVFVLLFIGLIDWFLRRQLKPGQALVTVDREGIESPIFTGKTKRYQWKDVVGVSIESTQNVHRLQLVLAESLGLPDKRNFWNGLNDARPAIQLSSFEPQVQERMLQAVNQRFQQYRTDAGLEPHSLVNPLVEERKFQERLKSFAPIPWITYLIIAINVLVWGITVIYGAGLLQAPADKLLLWGGNAASEVQHGQWWRLLTATFLHSGLMHLTMNMLGLVGAGIIVERIYGHRLFALIYLGSGLMGSALSLHFTAQHAVSVGASGAVFGVTGALLVGIFQHRRQLPKTFGKQTLSSIGFFIIYSLMQGFAKQGIDNAAHVGGLLGGCLCAFILPERFDMPHFSRTFTKRAIAALVIVGAATVSLAAMAPPATIDQARIFTSNEILIQSFKRFDEGMKALQQEQISIKAGKLSEREADERSRTVHAPVFRRVADDLSQVVLRPGDPREQFLKDVQRMAELLAESLAMDSVFNEESKKFEPTNPARAAKIEEEFGQISERTKKFINSTKNKGVAEKQARDTGNAVSNEAKLSITKGWPLDLDAFEGGMSVQAVRTLAEAKGYSLKCYGNLGLNERVRKDDKSACWVAIENAWGVPASMTAFTFGDDGLQTQLLRFPEASWPQVKQRLDQMGQHLPQTFGIDPETGGGVSGWRMNSGLIFAAAPPKGKELTVLWTAKKVVALDHCSSQGVAAKHIRQSYSVPIKQLWPDIDCEAPNS